MADLKPAFTPMGEPEEDPEAHTHPAAGSEDAFTGALPQEDARLLEVVL